VIEVLGIAAAVGVAVGAAGIFIAFVLLTHRAVSRWVERRLDELEDR
jgi:hypothetical protein